MHSDKFGWDLDACLQYNPQDGFTINDITEVIAQIEGEHDGAPYHWVLQLANGAIAYLTGSCDYTGWDCQSSAESVICDIYTVLDEITKYYYDNVDYYHQDVRENIARQMRDGCDLRWDEKSDMN